MSANRRRHLTGAGLVLASALVAACSPGPGRYDPAECGRSRIARTDIVVLADDGRLSCLPGAEPAKARPIGTVSGLGTETLVGIDYRSTFTDAAGVANGVGPEGVLYGLGSAGGIFTVDAKTAVATKRSQLSVALEGTAFDIDFNPTVDRLRIVSDNGQNLRVNVDTGAAIVDGALNYASVAAPGISAVAYTNVDSDPATATTLYDIDTTTDQLVVQNPPNNGVLVGIGGALGVDAGSPAGFDLYSQVKDIGAGVLTTTDVTGFAVLTVGGQRTLYRVTPYSGRLVAQGTMDIPVADIAIPLAQ